MELNFVNGNDVQKGACRLVANNLLNLPFDAIPLDVTVEFVADPSPALHNEFAYTESTSVSAYIRIAKVAPNWSLPWRGAEFLQETFAHELGHAYFSVLSKSARVAVAQMFGAKSDDPVELAPPGSAWENRILEGICETFKDAFLPQRFRRFANRTNRKISISRYPEFRGHFRDASGKLILGPNANQYGGLNKDNDPLAENVGSQDLFDNPKGLGLFARQAGLWPDRYVATSSETQFTKALSIEFTGSNGMWAPPEEFFIPPPDTKLNDVPRWYMEQRILIEWGGYRWSRIMDFELRTVSDGKGGFLIRRFNGAPAGIGGRGRYFKSNIGGGAPLKSFEIFFSTFEEGDLFTLYLGTGLSALEDILNRLNEELSPSGNEVADFIALGRVEIEYGNFEAAGMTIDAIQQTPMVGPGLGLHPFYIGKVPGTPITLPTAAITPVKARSGRRRSDRLVSGGRVR